MDEFLFKTDKRKIYPGSRRNTIVYLIFFVQISQHRAISLNDRAPALHAGSIAMDTKVINYFSAENNAFFFLQPAGMRIG